MISFILYVNFYSGTIDYTNSVPCFLDFKTGDTIVFLMRQHPGKLVRIKFFSFLTRFDYLRVLDWSHQGSNVFGTANRLQDHIDDLFHHQYIWSCTLSDANMGILCIEINYDKKNCCKH